MKKYYKWIFALIGFYAFGLYGAIIGFVVGMMLEVNKTNQWDEKYVNSGQESGRTYHSSRTNQEFANILVTFTAAIMKADGKVLKSELNFVKQFFAMQFGESTSREMLLELKQQLDQPVDLRMTGHRIRYYMQYQGRMQLLHYLFGIAKADAHISNAELDVIQRIASYMAINTSDFLSAKAMFIKETDGDYKILEIEKSASDEEVKAAYRKMAKKNHPDKVAHLGEDVKKGAEERFQRIQTAYENIKNERGI